MRKKIFYISLIILFILAAIGWLGYVYIYPDYQFWKFKQSYDKTMQAYADMLKNDTYGGKTPEETYNLYIAALQRGDTDAASKYFYWEYQNQEKQDLDAKKQNGELGKYIESLPEWKKLKEENAGVSDKKLYTWTELLKEPFTTKIPNGAGGYIEHTFKPGEYNQEIKFIINKQANIWKIYSA